MTAAGLEELTAGQTYHYPVPRVRAADIGPYPFPVRIDAVAYAKHDGGSDHSTASLMLYFDGNVVGSGSDQSFNSSHLNASYQASLAPGNIASFRLESGNSGANERTYGFDFTLNRG